MDDDDCVIYTLSTRARYTRDDSWACGREFDEMDILAKWLLPIMSWLISGV